MDSLANRDSFHRDVRDNQNRLSQSYGPRLQGNPQGLLRDPSSGHCFQIDMHEYGLPQLVTLDSTNEFIVNEPQMDNSIMLFENAIPPAQLYKNLPLIQFNPIEYGEISHKYKGDQLLFAEVISSTKIYLTQDQQRQKVSEDSATNNQPY